MTPTVGTAARVAPLYPGSFLWGSAGEAKANLLAFTEATHARCGDVGRERIGPPRFGLEIYDVHTPEAAEQLLSGKSWSDFRKDTVGYVEVRQSFGNGLLTSQDEDWLRQKRFIQPLFTHAHVDDYVATMLDQVEQLAVRWRRLGTKDGSARETDLEADMTHLTLQVIGRVLFGEDVEQFEAAANEHFPTIAQGAATRSMSAIRPPLSWPTPLNRRIRAAQQGMRSVCEAIIDHRRHHPTSGNDLVSMLLAARDGDDRLSTDEIRDQILVFLFAGHDTTSRALTFAFHLLGRHPEVQDLVREEVRSVLGDDPPTPEVIRTDLPYTTAVLKETLRLYPSAPLIPRKSTAPAVVSGYDIPAQRDVIISVWNIHRRPDLYPDPLRFDPTRFLRENEKDRHRYAWIPFGAGPRGCIGQYFSMLESVTAITQLVREFEFMAPPESTDHLPVNVAMTLYPLAPVHSWISPRDEPAVPD